MTTYRPRRRGRREPQSPPRPAGVLSLGLAADRAAAARRRRAAARRPPHRPRGATWLGAAMPARVVRARRSRMFLALLGRDAEERARRRRTCSPGSRSARFQVDVGLLLDPLSMCFVLLITGRRLADPRLLVGYMEHDPDRRRFFAYLNLFVAAMLLLVLADSYLRALRRLGGRRPRVVPADRVLELQPGLRRRRQEGVRRQPGRRLRPVHRDHDHVRARSARVELRRGLRRRRRARARAR